MNNLHAIIIKYVHPTNARPGRVSLKSGRHYAVNSRKLVPWNHEAGSRLEDQASC